MIAPYVTRVASYHEIPGAIKTLAGKHLDAIAFEHSIASDGMGAFVISAVFVLPDPVSTNGYNPGHKPKARANGQH